MADVRVRLVVARDPDFIRPIVCGAIEEDTWEVIPQDDWDETVRQMVESNAPGAVDRREAVVTFSATALADLFEHRIAPLSIAPADGATESAAQRQQQNTNGGA